MFLKECLMRKQNLRHLRVSRKRAAFLYRMVDVLAERLDRLEYEQQCPELFMCDGCPSFYRAYGVSTPDDPVCVHEGNCEMTWRRYARGVAKAIEDGTDWRNM